jgi:hypothetical protein
MTHRLKTIAIAAMASALTFAGMAVAHGDDRGWSGWPWQSASKSLTYSETHLQHRGKDVTLRVDQGRVTAASADSISIQRNDGEAVTVPVDGDTKVWAGWHGGDPKASKRKRGKAWHGKRAKAAHKKGRHHRSGARRSATVADIPVGKRVLVLRSDDDEAAEAVKATGWKHGHDHGRGHGRDRD